MYWHFLRIAKRFPVFYAVLSMCFRSTFRRQFFRNYFGKGLVLSRLGIQDRYVKLNVLDRFEQQFFYSSDSDCGEVQLLKRFLDEKSTIVFVRPRSVVMILFVYYCVGCRLVIVAPSRHIQSQLMGLNLDIVDTEDQVSDLTNDRIFLVVHEADGQPAFSDKFSHILVELSSPRMSPELAWVGMTSQLWANGRVGDFGGHVETCFELLTRRAPAESVCVGAMDQHKISGFSIMRSLDIYPFDLCYESVLPFVDEFLLFLDKDATDSTHPNRQLIDKFIAASQYSHKIKVIDDFDFKARFTKRQSVPGRWISDANNLALDYCRYDTCVYLMADEILHEDSGAEILAFAKQSECHALSHYFLHFIYDLKTIRNPKTVAYTHAVRVFKKDYFYSCHDGYSFQYMGDAPPVIQDATFPVFHFGYVMNLEKKVQVHMSEGGVFCFPGGAVKRQGWVDEVDRVPYTGNFPKYLGNTAMPSYSKIEPLYCAIKSDV